MKMKKPNLPVIMFSSVLLVYYVLALSGIDSFFTGFLFGLLPVMLAWMVYYIIRFGKSESRELEKDEEWGYADKQKEELHIF